MSLQQWAGASIILGVILTAVTLAVMIGKPLRRLAKQNDEFREDWYGTAARPGRPAVLGVPERLARLEQQATGRDGALAQAVAALREDVGATLLRVETRLDDHIRTHHSGV
ncbi:hypothetical protein [Micromonospora sp. CB01531]|uniref:hypothetical protein n=1 Tax=Micromonospora sp. CB01531 TaxID=1718947 RepID=UPI00093CE70B|nr:hypothetical protein [Micromonospora sp. CB01531]OKI47314.1 hypothetical protein A6A27_10730 [Micromonospora sp. CB01531]